MLATIWSELDALLPKKLDEKPMNTHLCKKCSGVKVITREGLPTCSERGLVASYFVDDTAESTLTLIHFLR